jgi:hypothetical protein
MHIMCVDIFICTWTCLSLERGNYFVINVLKTKQNKKKRYKDYVLE